MASRATPEQKRWSYAEYARLPDDGNRYEVIQGEVHMTPEPRPVHQLAVAELMLCLGAFVREHALGQVIPGPIDLVLSNEDIVQPDLVFVRSERMGTISDRGIEQAPDLVVEVLSKSTAILDRNQKRERYAWYGVPE